jgi:hypothetical protein
MTRAEVERETKSGRYLHLTFYGGDPKAWVVTAPYEFGAKNWILLIDISDDRVARVRVRTGDGIHDHPAQAPPDKQVAESVQQGTGEPPNNQMQRTRSAPAGNRGPRR